MKLFVDTGAWYALYNNVDDYDCTSLVLMRQLRLTDAFALDDHFEQMGFVIWPQTDW
jgi:predicted nucleic acid-binding protein